MKHYETELAFIVFLIKKLAFTGLSLCVELNAQVPCIKVLQSKSLVLVTNVMTKRVGHVRAVVRMPIFMFSNLQLIQQILRFSIAPTLKQYLVFFI